MDLHGCSVEEAVAVVRRTLHLAFQRGRARLVVVHGASTSDVSPYRLTIKKALQQAVGDGTFGRWFSDVVWDASGARCTFWIPIGRRRNPALMSVQDVL